ncbi:unnamed protein product [Rotaria socialis]|uniref:Zinc finger FYVE domain-containing protein 1 n=1 Tax=Rotaria socialis TaxID=392032 RepID=A0A818HLS7_9BILA|nr:unnamed protein product [Rotaria socialis]
MFSLMCTAYQTCDSKILSEAIVYCIQCNSLQCISCEKQMHNSGHLKQHERLHLDTINNERCSIDPSHPAVFYCSTCSLLFCYSCYESRHQNTNGREHKLQKCREKQSNIVENDNACSQTEGKTIYPELFSTANNNDTQKQNHHKHSSSSTFADVPLDKYDVQFISPSDQQSDLIQTKISPNVTSQQKQNTHYISKQEHSNDRTSHEHYQPNPANTDSNEVFLLLDGDEHLTVNSEFDFIRQFKCSQQDPKVKCVSIIGNTGDGKSYTLNQVFFNGKQKFHTSSTTESCTIGVWSTLDENQRTLILDTEGRLGLSQNDNIRNRLLLKILCVSDIVIYRTKAPKLPNDMFQFLSDASNAFLKYFKKELENVMKSCRVDGPVSAMGPTLIVFHETQYTEILRDHLQCQKTAVEQLKERFEKMNLSYDAYSSIEYVGTQTPGGESTDFRDIKAAITETLENNKIRSPRNLSVIFKVLKALNEKFNHAIPPEMPSTLPDDFFACYFKCLSCGNKCTLAANHQKEKSPHECKERCSYNKELDNEVWKCLQCHRDGRDTIVYGKLITKGDSLVQGLLKYVWSGFVIECPYHGEIYRSRKHWYGNNEPKDVTRVEVIHIWPGEDNNRVASDVTPRKFIEMVVYAGSYLSAPTKMLTEMVADQVAPSYWVPNKDVHECSTCKLVFGSDHSKHHCRACGHVFCDTCTMHRRVVAWIDTEKAVRVCDKCYANSQLRPPSTMSSSSSSSSSSSTTEKEKSDSQRTKHNGYDAGSSGDSASTASSGPVSIDIPATRRVFESVKSGLEKIGANYPIELIKESARPNYWRPDNECRVCCVCKQSFNSTTNRLHHCRNCGDAVCEKCSPNKRPVPERDWLTPVRVCKLCDDAMNESTSGH